MTHIKIPTVLKDFARVFTDAGFRVYLVGGAVRDSLMGKQVSDYDAATDALPADVCRMFRRVIPTGIKHGTVTVTFGGFHIEVTTFRAEEGYSDARRPDKVTFGVELETDLSRRDFTINAMAASLEDGKVMDFFGGKDDLRAKVVRTVGHPLSRLSEDGLRAVRAVRFSAVLGFEIEKETLKALSDSQVLEKVRQVSVERFREEFTKILLSPRASSAVRQLSECEILKLFLKDKDGNFNASPLECVLDESEVDLCERLCIFFYLYYFRDELNAFLFNEKTVSETQALAASSFVYRTLKKLRYSNEVSQKVRDLVFHFTFIYRAQDNPSRLRRFIASSSEETALGVAKIQKAFYGSPCFLAVDKSEIRLKTADKMAAEIKAEIADGSVFSLASLSLNGNDLMNAGIQKGPMIKKALLYLLDCVLENPSLNNKSALLSLVEKRMRDSSKDI